MAKRRPSHRLAGHSKRLEALPYEALLNTLRQDKVLIKKHGQSTPRKCREISLLEELQSSDGLQYLARLKTPDKKILDFAVWFCGELFSEKFLQSDYIEKWRQNPDHTYAKNMESTILQMADLIQDNKAAKFFADLEVPLNIVFSLSTALLPITKRLYTHELKRLRIAKAFRSRPPSRLESLKESNTRKGDFWRPLLVASASECESRFGDRMPTLLRDLFNTRIVKDVFPKMPTLNKDRIEKIMQRQSKTGKTPLKQKKNPYIPPLQRVDTRRSE